MPDKLTILPDDEGYFPWPGRDIAFMQPITSALSAVISPTLTAESRTYHGFISP